MAANSYLNLLRMTLWSLVAANETAVREKGELDEVQLKLPLVGSPCSLL